MFKIASIVAGVVLTVALYTGTQAVHVEAACPGRDCPPPVSTCTPRACPPTVTPPPCAGRGCGDPTPTPGPRG